MRIRDSILFLGLSIVSCTAPRSVLMAPDALPKGHVEAGVNMDVNIPTQTSAALYGGLKSGVNSLYDRASGNTPAAITADSLNDYVKAMVAYSLDPLGPQAGLFVRYGIWPRFDIGYRLDGGANAVDLHFQFLGPLAGDSTSSSNAWTGSLAVQYAWQSFDLPSVAGLDKLQELLQYEFKRKDVLVPLVFGKPFGQNGRYGGFGIGAVYNVSFVEYGSQVLKLVERLPDNTQRNFDPISGDKTISSYGGFTNLRLGYRWAYLVGSLACYWQDYGSFKLFGGQNADLEGWTFIPALAVEFHL